MTPPSSQALAKTKAAKAAGSALREKNVAGEASAAPASAKPSPPDGDDDAAREARLAAMVCSLENKDDCLMCGS